MRVQQNSKNSIFSIPKRYFSSFVKLINVTWKYQNKCEHLTKDTTKVDKDENYNNASRENCGSHVNFLAVESKVQDQMRRDDLPLFLAPSIETNKTIVVFYAKDHPNRADLQCQLSDRLSAILQRLFRLVSINVEEPGQIGLLAGLLAESDSDESIGRARSGSALLFCFLISAKVTSLIMDDTSHLQRCLLLCSATTNAIHRDTNHIITYALYDEANEINMFRIKYKLTQCTYIATTATSQVDLAPSILTTAIRLCNETLCQQQQEEVFSYCNFNQMLPNKKPLFKVFPKKLTEGNGKVWITFDKSIESDRHQIDVLLNGQSTVASLKLKWKNSQILQTTIPDTLLMECPIVQLAIVVDCAHFLGARYIKCETKQTDFNKLLSKATSADLLCQSFGVSTIEELDCKIATAFDESLPDFGIYRYVMPPECALATELLPTWLHFAAQYGLEQLMRHLLHSPTALRSCFTLNSSGYTPLDVALQQSHLKIVQILKNYITNIELIQQEVILNSTVRSNSCNSDDVTPKLTTQMSICNQFFQKPDTNQTVCLNNVTQEQPNSKQLSVKHLNSSLDGDNIQIMAAKEELLCIIDQFACGMPIELFERLFCRWEDTYSDVLQGQMSDQLLYSLNEIKKLCSVNDEDGECVLPNGDQWNAPNSHSQTSNLLKWQPQFSRQHCHGCDVPPIRHNIDVSKLEENQINFEDMDMQYHSVQSWNPGLSDARSVLPTVKSDSSNRSKPSRMQSESGKASHLSALVSEVEPPINRSVQGEVHEAKTRDHSHVEHDQYQRDNRIITHSNQDISKLHRPSGRETTQKVTSSAKETRLTPERVPCQKIYASGSNYYLVPRPFPLLP